MVSCTTVVIFVIILTVSVSKSDRGVKERYVSQNNLKPIKGSLDLAENGNSIKITPKVRRDVSKKTFGAIKSKTGKTNGERTEKNKQEKEKRNARREREDQNGRIQKKDLIKKNKGNQNKVHTRRAKKKKKKQRTGKRNGISKKRKVLKYSNKNKVIDFKQGSQKNSKNVKNNLEIQHKVRNVKASCVRFDCLKQLTSSLKLERDTIRNFLAQTKRLRNKLALMKSKEDKNYKYWETALYLAKRLGDSKDHFSDGPLCKGLFNSTVGILASELAQKLESCNSSIKTACRNHNKVTVSEIVQLDECTEEMHEFKIHSEKCQLTTQDCSCWKEISDKSNQVTMCNIAKDMEKRIKGDYNDCKQSFMSCSKLEDEAIEYMVQCYTSETQIKSNIKEMITIKDAATKLKTRLQGVYSSYSNNDTRSAGNILAEKRQTNPECVSCGDYNKEVEEVNKLFTQSILIGSTTTIVTLSGTILQQAVQVCNSTQLMKVKANIKTLAEVITKINIITEQYQKVLKTLTKTTLSLEASDTSIPAFISTCVSTLSSIQTTAPTKRMRRRVLQQRIWSRI